jgi:hypothetical protein
MVTEREATILQNYVERGGGLIVWLGDRVQAENYNQLLYRDGKGVLPALLHEQVGDAKNQGRAFLFDTANLEHPLLGRFRGNPGTGLETTLTFEYFRLVPHNEKPAQVALRYQSGDPAIVEASVGRGRSLLVATGADLSWGTWPVQRSFPPLVHEAVRFSVAGRLGERQHLVGEPIVRTVGPSERPAGATIARPDGQEAAVAVSDSADDKKGPPAILYDETNKSGVYELRFGAPANRVEQFAVNVEPRESDLAALTADEVRTELLPNAATTLRNDWPESQGTLEAAPSASELSGWLLVAALCLVFVEQLMAWNFAYGLILLYVCVAAAFTRQAFAWNSLAGAAVLVGFTAGLATLLIVRQRTLFGAPR